MYKAVFHYGNEYSECTDSSPHVLMAFAQVHPFAIAKVLDNLDRTGYAEWGWWTFTKEAQDA